MDAGHQGPATTPRGHVTEGLVDDTILSAEVIQAICRGNEPRDPLSEAFWSPASIWAGLESNDLESYEHLFNIHDQYD